jgi:lipopolysaccharide transport system ATP-binding protein
MVVRLASAVVAHTEPIILIVDEALAVGDAKFQARCMKRIRQLKEQGVTILFVSHDASSVKMLCHSAMLMNCGRMLEIGTPNDVLNHYIALLSADDEPEIETRITQRGQLVKQPDDISQNNYYKNLSRHGNQLAVIQADGRDLLVVILGVCRLFQVVS